MSANTLERLEIEILLSREQFTKELQVVQGQLGSLTAITGKTSNAIGGNLVGSMIKGNIATQLILGTVTKFANGVFNLTKQLMVNGSQLSRMRVATDTVARNMGLTSDEVDNLRDSLAESNTYGIKAEAVISSLARTGLMEMAKSLETVDARTGENVKGVNALVLTMKDLAAVAGVDSSEGIKSVTEFINRGMTGAVDGMIAIGNLGTEYRMYAQTLGKGRGDLTATEEAQARMNLVMREGKKALGAYSDSYTTSGKMMGSIRDATLSIFEEVGGALEPLWATVSSSILTFVQGVRNWLIDNGETIRAWATKVAGWIQWLVRSIGSLLAKIPGVGTYLQKLADFQVKSAKSGDKQTASLQNTTEAMGGATKSAKALNKELAGLAGFDEMNVLKAPEASGDVGGGGGGISSPLGADSEAGGGLLAGIDDAIKGFSEKISEFMGPIIEKIKEFFKPMVELWNTWVKPAFDGLLAMLKELWDSVKNSPVGEILKTIAQILGVIIVAAIGIVINVITGLVAIIKWQFEMWKKSFDKAVEDIANLIMWFRELGDKINEVWTSVKEWFIKVWTSIVDWFNKKIAEIKLAWEILRVLVSLVITKIEDDVKTKIDNIKSFFTGIFDTVKTVFTNITNTIWSLISTVVDKVVDKFNSLESGFVNFGTAVVIAIKDPINSVIDKINSFLGTIRGIKIPVIAPNGIQIPNIPKLATGGIVSSPTMALLGEAGREAVLPLDSNNDWMKELASKINERSGNINLVVKVGEEKIFEKAIDYINDKSLRNGVNILNI